MVELKPKKSIDDVGSLKGKKVLVRVDFNVPIENGEITNDLRIRAALPTIQKILSDGGSAILMSHLGRPEGPKYEGTPLNPSTPELKAESLLPVSARLEELLKKENPSCLPVLFAEDCLDAKSQVDSLAEGQVLLLENVRFYKNESSKKEEERLVMAKTLASYGDIFICDAFGTAHRNAATVTGIPSVMGQGAAGYLMAKEVEAFRQVLTDPPRPFCAIVGGSKVSDKILLLEQLMEKVNKLLIGGAMAYTFLKTEGKSIGKSFCQEGEILEVAKKLLEKAKEKGIEVLLPVDHVCHTAFEDTDSPLVTEDENIPDGYMALDIGPKTVKLYQDALDGCGAAIWNGPMGVFEKKTYSNGTFTIASTLGDLTEKNGMISIIGGGDSAAAAEVSGQAVRMSHVSTGGGASLELMEGKALPGIDALDDA
ncbi:hypothetical protein ACA910_002646 [Epithemia clementina (nom. ined.)]